MANSILKSCHARKVRLNSAIPKGTECRIEEAGSEKTGSFLCVIYVGPVVNLHL